MKRALLILALSAPLFGESAPHKAFRWSLIALGASNAADAASSYGLTEANPLLAQHGQFTGTSAGIKLGIVGAAMLTEWFIVRRVPETEKPVTITNFVMSGVAASAAGHNWRIH